MKPFLHLSIRDHDDAVAKEFDAIASFAGLKPGQLVQLRVEQAPLPVIRPDDYSGIVIGGGQFNTSDAVKTDTQRRVEADLGRIVEPGGEELSDQDAGRRADAELGDLSGHAVGLEAQAHPGRDGGEQGRGASEDLLGDHVGDGRRDGGLEDGHERAADPASPLPEPRGDEEHPAAHGPRSPGG